MDIEIIERTEQLIIAYHEAAHAVVARDCGVWAQARIERNTAAGPEERSWLGQTRIHTEGLSRNQRTHVALAGVIAECILAEGNDPQDMHPDDVAGLIFLDEMSDTDKWLAGSKNISHTTIVRAVLRVMKVWPDIKTEAQRLIRDTEG